MGTDPSHIEWMGHALEEARKAADHGEVPVGAVVVHEGRIVGRGGNQPISRTDPTAHAEMVALRSAGEELGVYRLVDCDLYVTLEPCLMCCGAIVHARIQTLIYGAVDPKTGEADLLRTHPRFNHRVEVVSGVEEDACGKLLRDFFREKRDAFRQDRG